MYYDIMKCEFWGKFDFDLLKVEIGGYSMSQASSFEPSHNI